MRRKQTRVTVWPAIADLMTAILVITFLSGMVVYINNSDGQTADDQETKEMLRDSIDNLKIQVDSLLSVAEELVILQDSIKKLQDDEGKIGSRSCLGRDERKQPNSLMTIQFNPENYQIRLNEQHIESGWLKLQQYVRPFDQRELSKSEMINFASGLSRRGKEYAEGACTFFVRVEDGGVPKDSLALNWHNYLGRYLGLVNPRITYK